MSDEQQVTTPDEANFRKTLGRLPTGVVIVTGGDPEQPSGLVVGSFMSVSLEPPLVCVCPAKTSTSWPAIEESGIFCANVLHSDQEALARTFSKSGIDKFVDVNWAPAPATGAPLLEGVSAWIDCKVDRVIEAGDHWLVLGEVLALSVHPDNGALAFLGGTFHQLH
jgi:3-hydroxy-9,10-secoandrosta-1,3,5(10)-triene-9,17-dione monooxygenase reductase component